MTVTTLKDYGNEVRGKPIFVIEQSNHIDTVLLSANVHAEYTIPTGESYRIAIVKGTDEIWVKVDGQAIVPSGESLLDGSSAEMDPGTALYIEDATTIGLFAPRECKANIVLLG